MATPVPFPLSSRPGAFAGEGQGRLVNCYADKDGDATFWRRVPGMAVFGDLGLQGGRGAMGAGSVTYFAVSGTIQQVGQDGSVTSISGVLPGTGPVTMARNNKAPLFDAVVVTSDGAVIVDGSSGGVIRPYPGLNLPQPNSVSSLDGFLLFTTANGTIWASDLNDTNVNALSFARAESNPDGLLRGVTSGEQYLAFGQNSLEVYSNAGTQPFPLSRVTVVPIGLLGPWAIAGFEDGWSGVPIFVASDGTVRSLDGYTPTRVSTADVERAIKAVASPTDLRAKVYTFAGNAIWSLSSPMWTWEYNVNQGFWHERESVGLKQWRGGISIRAFNRWLVTDLLGTKLSAIDQDEQTELGSPLVWGADSGLVKSFPSSIKVVGATLDFIKGQGAAAGTEPDAVDPQVEISWSRDGGYSYGRPLLRSLGMQGDMARRRCIKVNRMGLATDAGFRLRWRISDPRPTTFLGAALVAGAQ